MENQYTNSQYTILIAYLEIDTLIKRFEQAGVEWGIINKLSPVRDELLSKLNIEEAERGLEESGLKESPNWLEQQNYELMKNMILQVKQLMNNKF